RLWQRLTPFVYRRYIDYGVFESLREMKLLIEREVNRKGMQDNVKLGRGGIREVEFTVQVFQLIRGGQDKTLREPNLLTVLPRMAAQGLLEESVATELAQSYVFLRDVEHRLQAVGDRQTQKLPGDTLGWQRLAWSMGFLSVEAFQQALDEHRQCVRRHFDQVVAEPEGVPRKGQDLDVALLEVWLGRLDAERAAGHRSERGMAEAQEVVTQLDALRESRVVTQMQAIGRELLDRLMPLLLATVAGQQQGAETCARLLAFVEAVARRSA